MSAEPKNLPKHWEVEVRSEGESEVTIGNWGYSGNPEPNEAAIIRAAEHLLSFAGDNRLAVYDALEARHARVREAAEAASKALTMAVHALRSYQHFNSSTELAESAADHCEPVLSALRAALEEKA